MAVGQDAAIPLHEVLCMPHKSPRPLLQLGVPILNDVVDDLALQSWASEKHQQASTELSGCKGEQQHEKFDSSPKNPKLKLR